MLSRRTLISKAFVSVVSFLVFGGVAFASTVDWWHGLSQSDRNTEILDTGTAQNHDYTGLQCKQWVQEVVYQASQGTVYPPQNKNDYQWKPHPDVRVATTSITSVKPGQIIQMRWRNQSTGATTPHTAIVVSRSSSGMWWVDCNWNSDGTVRVHSISFSQFSAAVGSYFTVYEIK